MDVHDGGYLRLSIAVVITVIWAISAFNSKEHREKRVAFFFLFWSIAIFYAFILGIIDTPNY